MTHHNLGCEVLHLHQSNAKSKDLSQLALHLITNVNGVFVFPLKNKIAWFGNQVHYNLQRLKLKI
jgi:hypothetical protein